MDQCLLPKKYPKIFLISSKLITTKPPLFSSDMLNHPCLQFLELHKSQKRAGGAVRGFTAGSPGNELGLPQLPSRLSLWPSSTRSSSLSVPITALFSHLPTAVFTVLLWSAMSLGIPNSTSQPEPFFKGFSSLPVSEHGLPATRQGHCFLHTGMCYSWGKRRNRAFSVEYLEVCGFFF